MMSKIEWTGESWNPIVGCTVTSPGCKNCYAMKSAMRQTLMNPKSHYCGTVKEVNGKAVWTGEIAEAPEHIWKKPLKRKKPQTYFVNSMGDLFHPNIDWKLIDRVFAIMAICNQHTFQILTKHSDRMRDYVLHRAHDPDAPYIIGGACYEMGYGNEFATKAFNASWPLRNVWLGVSTEDQARATQRLPDLERTPAALRFVSYEPALELIDFGPWIHMIDWIIAGGESGKFARWISDQIFIEVREQFRPSGTPFFMKQLITVHNRKRQFDLFPEPIRVREMPPLAHQVPEPQQELF